MHVVFSRSRESETGIAVVFGTQLLPAGAAFDMQSGTLWPEVETAIYAGLEK